MGMPMPIICRHFLRIYLLNQMKKLTCLTILTLVLMLTLNVGCKQSEPPQNSKESQKKKIDPPIDQIAYLNMSSMNQYLNGLLCNLEDLNPINSQFAIYNHLYDSTSVFSFSSLEEMEDWLEGKSFEAQVLRANHLCDSMSLVVNENDTLPHDWDLHFFREKPKASNTKLFKATTGGFKFWDGAPATAPPTTFPPPGTGAHSYFYGIVANFGSWNNRATTFHIYGTKYQTFCSQKKFMGRRFFNIVLGAYGHSLLGTTWDNNIMSAF